MKKSSRVLKHYSEAFVYLNTHFPTYALIVAKIGKPQTDSSQPTASVSLDSKTSRFYFRMNPNFFDDLQQHEKAFVLAHEATHVLFDHLTAHNDPHYTHSQALQMACECHVNDSLLDMGMVGPEEKVTGAEVLGYSTAGMRLRDIYDAVVQNTSEEESQNIQERISSECGNCNDDPSNRIQVTTSSGSTDSEQGNSDTDTQQEAENSGQGDSAEVGNQSQNDEALDNARNKLIVELICDDDIDYGETNEQAPKGMPGDAKDAVNAKSEGHSVVEKLATSTASLAEKHDVSIDFLDFLEKINPALIDVGDGRYGFVPEASFRTPNHRYGSLTNAVLPIWETDDYDSLSRDEDGSGKEVILFALDFSGSVNPEMANVMEKLMAVIPKDKATLYACTFSDYAVEYEPGVEDQDTAAGGTNFKAVVGYVDYLMEHKGLKHYPTVVYLTDGGSCFDYESYVRVYFQDGENGVIRVEVPSQEVFDKYYRFLLFDSQVGDSVIEYMSDGIAGMIDPDTVYDLADFVDF